MKILGIDMEIGNPFSKEDGSDWPKDEAWVTEFGMVMYDTKYGTQPVKSFETLVYEEGKYVSPDAEEYTGITTALIEEHGSCPSEFVSKIFSWLDEADYVVAHNGNKADKPWLKFFLMRYSNPEAFEACNFPHWIDSLIDVEYPNNCRAKNLTYLQAFHGFVNPFPHRAGSDVLTMMKIFFQYPLERIIAVTHSPQVILKALGPIDTYSGNNKGAFFKKGTAEYEDMEHWKKMVKKGGYRWDGDAENTGSKCWYKFTRQLWIDEGKENPEIQTIVIQPPVQQ